MNLQNNALEFRESKIKQVDEINSSNPKIKSWNIDYYNS